MNMISFDKRVGRVIFNSSLRKEEGCYILWYQEVSKYGILLCTGHFRTDDRYIRNASTSDDSYNMKIKIHQRRKEYLERKDK